MEVFVVSAQLQAMVAILGRVVEAVVGARAGDDEVGSPACCKAVEELPVIVLQCAKARYQACYQP